jgi:hypothetical protein
MLATRLVRLIEAHSEQLSRGLTERILSAERTSDFRKIPPEELRLAVVEVYRHLGEWLLQKTEADIAHRFRAIAARRSSEGIRLHQLVCALTFSREHLLNFLRREALADTIVALHGELELHALLTQFFDRAIYFAIQGYEAGTQAVAKDVLARAQDLAVSIGLIPEHKESAPR